MNKLVNYIQTVQNKLDVTNASDQKIVRVIAANVFALWSNGQISENQLEDTFSQFLLEIGV